MRKHLDRENARWPDTLQEVPREEWPNAGDATRIQVFRSRRFLVQVFEERGGVLRLSVNRTALLDSGRWHDGIGWDELQALKREAGYGDREAVEIYPPDRDVVNVANMRHLWLLPAPLPFGWRAATHTRPSGGGASEGDR